MAQILVYDSGVGGLSVHAELHKTLANHQLDFLSDNSGFPYGSKTEADLLARVQQVVEAIVKQLNPDILVLACNSASTIALPCLREQYDLPIVGVVPAIKPAAALTSSANIALLATPGTINRQYTQQLIDDYASDIQVHCLGSSLLVEMAERKLAGDAPAIECIEKELQPLLAQPWDVLVLACTHFPLLEQELQQVLQKVRRSAQILDSGKAIARRVASLLEIDSENKTCNTAYFTELNGVPLSMQRELRKSSLFKLAELTL